MAAGVREEERRRSGDGEYRAAAASVAARAVSAKLAGLRSGLRAIH
jgi:hypothetical protein